MFWQRGWEKKREVKPKEERNVEDKKGEKLRVTKDKSK